MTDNICDQLSNLMVIDRFFKLKLEETDSSIKFYKKPLVSYAALDTGLSKLNRNQSVEKPFLYKTRCFKFTMKLLSWNFQTESNSLQMILILAFVATK